MDATFGYGLRVICEVLNIASRDNRKTYVGNIGLLLIRREKMSGEIYKPCYRTKIGGYTDGNCSRCI